MAGQLPAVSMVQPGDKGEIAGVWTEFQLSSPDTAPHQQAGNPREK